MVSWQKRRADSLKERARRQRPSFALTQINGGGKAVATDLLPDTLPTLRLYQRQVLWLLAQLGFRGMASERTFKEYIKSLRKLGIPFARGEIGFNRRTSANYLYHHIMELALALTLRVYNSVPDSLLVEIIQSRTKLNRFYRQAYLERCSGKGAPIAVKIPGRRPIRMRGLFLDLQLDFSGGRLTSFGPPKLLAAPQALAAFAESDLAARSLLPINLSQLSERVVAYSLAATSDRDMQLWEK